MQLTDDEINERAKELANLECRLAVLTEKFATKRKKHNEECTKLKDRIAVLSKEIDSGEVEAVQEALPMRQAGSGPDAPKELMDHMDDLRDGDEQDEFERYRRDGRDAFAAGAGKGGNPHRGAGEIAARKRAAWDEGFESAEEAAELAAAGDE